MNRYFLFFNFILVLSCSKSADIDVPTAPVRLVLDAKVLQGDSATVTLRSSYPTYEEDEQIWLDSTAKIVLFENGVAVDTMKPTHERQFRYISRYLTKPNTNYTVEASYVGFPSVHGSTQTLDKESDILNAEIITKEGETELHFQLQDRGNYSNAYLIYVLTDSVPYRSIRYLRMESFDPSVRTFVYDGVGSFDQESSSGIEFYLSDVEFDGATKNIILRVADYQWEPYISFQDSLELVVVEIESLWYEHEQSKYNQTRSSLGVFSEPARIVQNVENGYGIVRAGRVKTSYIKI
ncbi:MAG: DUF4249 family protein [Bacteroidetes bacterium]|nr:MAG: DUF4249 family protein [Bacteroidota bacterium]